VESNDGMRGRAIDRSIDRSIDKWMDTKADGLVGLVGLTGESASIGSIGRSNFGIRKWSLGAIVPSVSAAVLVATRPNAINRRQAREYGDVT